MTDRAASGANAEQIAFWNEVGGPKWVRYQAMLDRQLDAVGEAAMDAAHLVDGEVVLDIGCGCGSTSLALARRVAPSGRAVGLDISQPMLDLARQRARAEDVTNVSFTEADAQVHPFRPEFDVLFSRFGVMFFDDPDRAFTNLHAGLRSGARLAFVCWQALHKNPWMSVPMMAAFQHVTMDAPPSPDAPGPFAFAHSDRVEGILTRAGFRNIALRGLDVELPIGGGADLDDTVSFLLDMGPLGRVLTGADASVKAAVARDVRKSIAGYARDNGVEMAGAVWIVTADA
jgi:SAM-dependent methyltransferase